MIALLRTQQTLAATLALWLTLVSGVQAVDPRLPPGDATPVLRLETGGPRSYVSSLAFSPDGRTLYAGGWDKAVQAWRRQAGGRFEYTAQGTLRLPGGAGLYGGLNALTLSDDGQWLAAAGQGHIREIEGERGQGWIVPSGYLSQEAQLDEGLIYVFHVPSRAVTLLRGHRGPVQSLAFVRGSRSQPPELVSIAEERVPGKSDLQPRGRFWSVKDGRELAGLASVPSRDGAQWVPLPALQGWRPGLAAWSTGAEPRQARVAVSWGDDQFRIWDVRTGQVAHARSNANNLLALALPGGRILTGAHAEIGAWSVPMLPDGGLGGLERTQFEPARIESVNGRERQLPSAATLIPAGRNRGPLLACVVTHYLPDGRGEYRLVLAAITPQIKVVRERPLPWRAEIRLPALASTSDGSQLAVAGNERNEIEVYSVDELLAEGAPRPEVLGSVGQSFSEVHFARQDKKWGLLLREAQNPAGPAPIPGPGPGLAPVAGGLLMDFARRQIVRPGADWKNADAPSVGIQVAEREPGRVVIQQPNAAEVSVVLDAGYRLTAAAVCPPSAHCPAPLVALATQQRGQPRLEIYRADTGEPVRRCTGHTERIRGLAFAEDGRMLASTADDRTVSIWTLTDLLERTWGQRGAFPGVVVREQDGKPVVTEAASRFPLQVGDQLLGVVNRGETTELRGPHDFYGFVLGQRPGTEIKLSVRRQGQARIVECRVGQAVDEAKPLFTMFVTEGYEPGAWAWIGWHPLGNFDASDPQTERLLGWHFNTGEVREPARFATIGEYRDAFYRRDLLGELLEKQQLIVPAVQEAPKTSLWLRDRDGAPIQSDFDDRFQLRTADVELVADVSGVPDRRIQGIDVVYDDGAAQPLAQNIAGEWTANLARLAWSRGPHRLLLRVQLPDRQVTQLARVQFHPPAPSLLWTPPPEGEIKSAETTLVAALAPSIEPMQAQLILRPPGAPERVLKTWETSERLEIREIIPLLPGENQVELLAWNASASDQDRDVEQIRRAAVIKRAAPPQAPRWAEFEVLAVPAKGEPAAVTSADRVYRTSGAKVRLKGRIVAQVPLDSAGFIYDGKDQAFQGFAGKVREYAFDQVQTLTPGRKDLVLHAAVEGQTSELRATLIFAPPVPQVNAPTYRATLARELPAEFKLPTNVLEAGFHQPSAVVSVDLAGALDHPYHADVLVNDQPLPADAIAIDRGAAGIHQLRANVPLAGGKNRITIRVGNDWSRETASRSLELEYRRPPEAFEVQAPSKLIAEPLDLTCRIRSPLPLRSAWLMIDNEASRREATVTPAPGVEGEWLLRAEQIGLAAGEHVVRIAASNDEGSTIVPAVHRVVIEKPAEPPPALTLLSPVTSEQADKTVTTSSAVQKVEFAVKSATGARVSISSTQQPEPRDLGRTAGDGAPLTALIPLVEGVNDIHIVASNGGGVARVELRVSYVTSPADVVVLSIGELSAPGRGDGEGMFVKPLPSSRGLLRGKVVIRDPSISSADQLAARIWVNSFKSPTVPVVIDSKSPGIGLFECEVVFTRRVGNLIRVEVFRSDGKVAASLGSTTTLRLDCLEPERRQELYVLLLGAAESRDLRDRVQNALLAKSITDAPAGRDVLRSEAFSRIYMHEALNATAAVVQNQLRSMVGKMQSGLKTAAKGGPQPVVMIYYHGRVIVHDDDFAFVTTDLAGYESQPITGRVLERYLTRSYGAHLIFLDLQQEGAELPPRELWPKAPHLGVVIANWKGRQAQPSDLRLITALEQNLPRSAVVRDLAENIDRRYLEAQRTYPDQVETVELLKNVYDLRLGAQNDGR